jgi:hypothetical protein
MKRGALILLLRDFSLIARLLPTYQRFILAKPEARSFKLMINLPIGSLQGQGQDQSGHSRKSKTEKP